MTRDEQILATEDFYYYESRFRGYYHFGFPVPLEVPYQPFAWRETQLPIDDGKVPSLFKRIIGFVNSKPSDKVETTEYQLPEAITRKREVKVLKWSFSGVQDINVVRTQEMLNMLSLTRDVVSFEIIATSEDIIVQLTSSDYDYGRVHSHIMAYFPDAIITEGEQFDIPFETNDEASDIAIADFGLEYETHMPIAEHNRLDIDPLTSVIAQMEALRAESVVLFQVLFQGVRSPIVRDLVRSLDGGNGMSFFPENPEMLAGVKEKVSKPLLACVMRIACQGTSKVNSEYLAKEFISSVERVSDSGENGLVALSNEGYDYDQHVLNVFYRQSNRLGMVLNTSELSSFVHYPNSTIVSEKLRGAERVGKSAPEAVIGQKCHLGINEVGGELVEVSLSDEQRLSHTHVIGVTGMGKSTLLANMFLNDVKSGGGAVMFDPHGDIVEDILKRIPEYRKDDVVLLDPSDTDFPIGFNLLHAESEAEKLVLSSDLVSAFRSFSTSWGDRMTSVLGNVIDTFLDSEHGGTLIDVKRFLLEKSFRQTFLKTVSDLQLLYYWENEYGLINRASISPLLTRIDTFLRPKIVRLMMSQKKGLDLKSVMNDGKILLVKLSQGLIGRDNAFLLGSLLVSKLGQIALGRQTLAKSERNPFYIYMDEFQNIMSDSLAEMLSGVRKYGIGLVLAHQDLEQLLSMPELRESVLSNPNIRICFRLGDRDAKLMETGFSSYDMNDILGLQRGKAIMRVSGATNDFHIEFPPLPEEPDSSDEISKYVICNTRENYAKPRHKVEEELNRLFSKSRTPADKVEDHPQKIKSTEKPSEESQAVDEPIEPDNESINKQKEDLKEQGKEKRLKRVHEQLKVDIGTLAQSKGFRIVYEEKTDAGGRIDVSLHNEKHSIACEISITNSIDYEVQNIKKCCDAGYGIICMISPDEKHLHDIQKKAKVDLDTKQLKKVSFLSPDELSDHLSKYEVVQKSQERIINGYRVKVKYSDTNSKDSKSAQESIAKTVFDRLKKKKK